MREGPAAVGGLVDADAGHRRAEQVGLAGANPDDVGIRGGDRDVADAGRGVVFEHGLPRRAVVVGLPHAARRVGGVDASRAALFRDGHVGRAPADVGRTKRLPRDSAIRRCLHHRAVGVVRAPQIFGVRLRRLLRPEIGRENATTPDRTDRRARVQEGTRLEIIRSAYHPSQGHLASRRAGHFFLRLPRGRVAAETLMRGHASRSRSRVSS